MTRALIVDDKEDNLYYLRALLEGHGCMVEVARHGAEALFRARQAPPDLVVSDLLMPVMDGYTLLRHWKADARLKATPFIVYTATYTEAEDERLAMSLGADAFILKPAEPEAFLARLREVQANAAAALPTPPRHQSGDEKELLKVYSETLIRKLEEKSLQLEAANRALQQDIAERMQAEERLRESEERFRATFEQAAVGIAHVDADGRFLRVNDKLCEITGHPRDELLRLTFSDLTAPEDRPEGEEARLSMLARRRATYTAEKRYRRKDGSLIWVSLVTTLLRDQAGAPKYFITVIADITQRRNMEQQFLRAQRMESIGTLASGIAHDLNNVLAPIMMSLELLKLKLTEAEDLELLGTLHASAQRGAALIRQVLSFSRGLEGRHLTLAPLQILEDIRKIIGDTFPKNIAFRLKSAPDLPTVTGDPTQLHQVFMNLCVNARDAMPNGGQLTVTLERAALDEVYAGMDPDAKPGDYVLIKVTDTGTGMPPEIRDRIFEPFFTTKETGQGTGLGLSTVLAIVRSHAGFIHVHSEPGKGSEFQVYLPARAAAVADEEAEMPSPPLPQGHGELVLVVDDEEAIRAVAKRMLEQFGYRTLLATHGAEAVALYAQHRADIAVVLTDMAMPVMDGPSLVVALKSIDPGVRIIGTSGLMADGNPAKVISAGVRHFVSKPYTAETMLGTLAAVLQEPA